jgi:hypothetical protein
MTQEDCSDGNTGNPSRQRVPVVQSLYSRYLELSSDLLGYRFCLTQRGRQRRLLGQVVHSSKVSLVPFRNEPEMEVVYSFHQRQVVDALDSCGSLDCRNPRRGSRSGEVIRPSHPRRRTRGDNTRRDCGWLSAGHEHVPGPTRRQPDRSGADTGRPHPPSSSRQPSHTTARPGNAQPSCLRAPETQLTERTARVVGMVQPAISRRYVE